MYNVNEIVRKFFYSLFAEFCEQLIVLVDGILYNGLLIFLRSEWMKEMQCSQQGCGELQLNDNAVCVKIIPRARWFPED